MSQSPIQIEKAVPLPRLNKRGRPAIYPFREMSVGDSFAAPVEAEASLRSLASTRAQQIGGGVSFTVRKNGDGVRVWRIA